MANTFCLYIFWVRDTLSLDIRSEYLSSPCRLWRLIMMYWVPGLSRHDELHLNISEPLEKQYN